MKYYKKDYVEEMHKDLPNRFETKEEYCQRRNGRLLNFLSDVNHDIRLIGNPENPAIIVDDSYCLSAYVNNFYLCFTDQPKHGRIVERYKLKSNEILDSSVFESFWGKYEHRRIYKIRLINTDLFVCGSTYVNSVNVDNNYPVFSHKGYKVYFKMDSVEQVLEKFSDYPLKVE